MKLANAVRQRPHCFWRTEEVDILHSPPRRSHLEGKLLLTVEEAAQRLGIGRSHAYVYVLRGELPSVKLGRARRVPADELERFCRAPAR